MNKAFSYKEVLKFADIAAYKKTKDISKMYNFMFTQYLYNGRLTQIDQTGKIWRNANTSQLVNLTLSKNLPVFTRYSNIFGRAAAVLTTLDIGGSLYKGITYSTIQEQLYYLTEGVIKTLSYIPNYGTLWGLGFEPVVRPTWENGAKNIDNAIKHGLTLLLFLLYQDYDMFLLQNNRYYGIFIFYKEKYQVF